LGRQIRRLLVSGLVADIHKRSRGTYGMLRIRAALIREQDMVVNKKLILSIMRELGIKGLPGPKRRKKNLVNEATEEDLVQRHFTVDRPNVLWLTDITEHPTRRIQSVVATPRDGGGVRWFVDSKQQTARSVRS
jgi:putative transposase